MSKLLDIKLKAETYEQFYILSYLKDNLNLELFDLFIFDRKTIKVVDSNDDVLYFSYNNYDVYFYE